MPARTRGVVAALLVAVATGCDSGGGGGGGGAAPPSVTPTRPGLAPGTGELSLLVHDAPSPEVAQALVTIDGVSACSVASGWLDVSSAAQTIDLMALRD